MNEKPLHVRVAEALGWQQKDEALIAEPCPGADYWVKPGADPQGVMSFCTNCTPDIPPRYDTDWAATGPLIERYGIAVFPTSAEAMARTSFGPWTAAKGTDCESGETPLLAACRMILWLGRAKELGLA